MASIPITPVIQAVAFLNLLVLLLSGQTLSSPVYPRPLPSSLLAESSSSFTGASSSSSSFSSSSSSPPPFTPPPQLPGFPFTWPWSPLPNLTLRDDSHVMYGATTVPLPAVYTPTAINSSALVVASFVSSGVYRYTATTDLSTAQTTVQWQTLNTGDWRHSFSPRQEAAVCRFPVPYPDGSPSPHAVLLLSGGTDAWFLSSPRYGDLWRSDDDGRTWTLAMASAPWAAWNGFAMVRNGRSGNGLIVNGLQEAWQNVTLVTDVWRVGPVQGVGGELNFTYTQLTDRSPWGSRSRYGLVWMDGDQSDWQQRRSGLFLLVAGGIDGIGHVTNEVTASVDDGVTWTVRSASPAFAPRQSFSLLVLGDYLMLTGGTFPLRGSPEGSLVWASRDFGYTWAEVTGGVGTVSLFPFTYLNSMLLLEGRPQGVEVNATAYVVSIGGWGIDTRNMTRALDTLVISRLDCNLTGQARVPWPPLPGSSSLSASSLPYPSSGSSAPTSVSSSTSDVSPSSSSADLPAPSSSSVVPPEPVSPSSSSSAVPPVPNTTTSSSPSASVILVCVAVPLLVVVMLSAAAMWYWRKTSRRQMREGAQNLLTEEAA